MYSLNHNRPKSMQTASPDKYPQGYFKDKACKQCLIPFKPSAPSELYCSDYCKGIGVQDAYLLRNYGITLADYQRMLLEQKDSCKICGSDGFVMNTTRHKVKLVVDHCHATGRVRGLLCHNCNRALGLLKDNEESLLNAIAYLKA